MKTYIKLIICCSVLIIVGMIGTAIADYKVMTPITAVDINSHDTDDIVFAGGDYTVTCTTSYDNDCNASTGVWWGDFITYTWSGAGTFNPGTETSSTWTAPPITGNATITVTADDDSDPVYADDPNVTDSVTLIVVYDKAFSILDGSDNNIAIFDNLGNLFLKGTLDVNSTHAATAVDEFRFQDSNSNDLAIIDANDGNMYIDGQLFENQGTLTPSGSNHFIIEDASGNTVAYIDDPNGDLYLKGKLYEQVL